MILDGAGPLDEPGAMRREDILPGIRSSIRRLGLYASQARAQALVRVCDGRMAIARDDSLGGLKLTWALIGPGPQDYPLLAGAKAG